MKWFLLPPVAAALAVVLVTGPASAAGAPGGQSIGDPYFPNDGNTGYEVDHYGLQLTYQPGADHLSGTATIKATTTQELSSFSFDLGLDTSAVTVDNVPASFKKKDAKLIITPKESVAADHPMTVVVTYAGVPGKLEINGEKAWEATPDGAASTSEPHYAAFWFPANDHPQDKATFDVSVTVPDGTSALSAGTLTGPTKQGGQSRWDWHSAKPQATYLEFLAIGRYTVTSGTASDGRPFVNAYDQRMSASDLKAAKASVDRTPEVIAWEESLFGPYPFEAEGGVVANSSSGDDDAEEFQTRPVYYSGSFDDGTDMSVVVHENAHQWFGDAVSPHYWRDIWLNEGFATYAEWMWAEHTGGKTVKQTADASYQDHQDDDSFWAVAPADPGAANLLHDAVYDRGAMTLQALRVAVGDDAFFSILRQWASRQQYATGSTDQFIALAEQVSGKSLQQLFDTWLVRKGRPDGPPDAAVSPARGARQGMPPAL
jgi:aminopeptidase N